MLVVFNVASFLISDGSSFKRREAATLKASHRCTCHPHAYYTCLYSLAAEPHRPLAGTFLAYPRKIYKQHYISDIATLLVTHLSLEDNFIIKLRLRKAHKCLKSIRPQLKPFNRRPSSNYFINAVSQ